MEICCFLSFQLDRTSDAVTTLGLSISNSVWLGSRENIVFAPTYPVPETGFDPASLLFPLIIISTMSLSALGLNSNSIMIFLFSRTTMLSSWIFPKTIRVGPGSWENMEDEGLLFDITRFTKHMGVHMPVGISAGMFRELNPWAEDIAAGASYEGRIKDLIEGYKKRFRNHHQPYGEFFIKFTTRVKGIVNPEADRIEAETFAGGKKVDKVVQCFVGLFPKGNTPGILFGIKGERGKLKMKEGENNEFFGGAKPGEHSQRQS